MTCSKLEFQVTQIGCGLAGLSPALIAGMFVNAPINCFFDYAWGPFLPHRRLWGTYPHVPPVSF